MLVYGYKNSNDFFHSFIHIHYFRIIIDYLLFYVYRVNFCAFVNFFKHLYFLIIYIIYI